YGLWVLDVSLFVGSSICGQQVGEILQSDRRFDFVIRLTDQDRTVMGIAQLPIPLPNGGPVRLADVATVSNIDGMNQVRRENGKRRIIVTANVEGRDLGSFVQELQSSLTT